MVQKNLTSCYASHKLIYLLYGCVFFPSPFQPFLQAKASNGSRCLSRQSSQGKQEAVSSQHLCLVELEATTDYVHDTNQLTNSGSHHIEKFHQKHFFPSISLLVTEDSGDSEVFIIQLHQQHGSISFRSEVFSINVSAGEPHTEHK
jgi:hypothetical protein